MIKCVNYFKLVIYVFIWLIAPRKLGSYTLNEPNIFRGAANMGGFGEQKVNAI